MAYPPPLAITDAPPWDSARAYSYMLHIGVLVAFGRDELDALWVRRREWFFNRYRWRALDMALAADLARWPLPG